MLTQSKVDLAVLLKLYQHAEDGGGAITPDDISRLFAGFIPLRRIEVALDGLAGRREVDREYHPFYSDEGLWQISRSGIETVERALGVPASFIARLHANGDHWLASDEASAAKLSKNRRYEEDRVSENEALAPALPSQPDASRGSVPAINIHNNYSPNNTQSISPTEPQDNSTRSATWVGAWGTWFAGAVAVIALLVTLYLAGKL